MRAVGTVLVVVAVLLGGCTGHGHRPRSVAGPSTSISTASPSTVTPGAPSGATHVVAGGLAIDVPGKWPTISRPNDLCPDDLRTPAVIVGPLGDVRSCVAQRTPAGPEVIFASGGPPDPPVPTGEPEARIVNGVAVLVATADVFEAGKEAEFLAVFPDWDVSLRVGVKAGRPEALAAGIALLSTVSVTGNAPPPGPPAPASFVGHWHVHGAQLDIGERTAVLTSDCGPSCLYRETMMLSLSPDGRRLNAMTSRITYTDPRTGRPVPNPDDHPGDSSGIGDTSYFEYAAPHLLKETFVHSSVTDDFGNPYWCGEGLAALLGYHCGA